MENVPKIVVKRLQSPAPESHPDADLLTAFAEQSLAGRELGDVLEHLARCGDCRDVVALALPATEAAALIRSESATRGWFSWPVLRWGFVAAGIVAVASVGVLQYRVLHKDRHQENVLVSTNVIPQDRSAGTAQSAVPASQTSASGTVPRPPVVNKQAEAQQPATARAYNTLSVNKPMPSSPAFLARSQPMVGTGSGGGIGGGSASAGGRLGGTIQSNGGPGATGPAETAKQNPAPGPAQQSAAGASQVVEVQSEAVQVTAQATAPNQTQDQFSANEAEPSQPSADRVGRAKPALAPGTPVGMAPAPMLRNDPSLMKTQGAPRWTISSSGALQRSLDGGQTWLDVDITANDSAGLNRVRLDQNRKKSEMKIVQAGAQPAAESEVTEPAQTGGKTSARAVMKSAGAQTAPVTPTIFRALAISSNTDIWAGGSGGALYHTVDGGNLWARVLPSASGTVLTGDIVSIQFADPRNGSVTTSNAEIWTTPDGGQTWRKQQ